ncbi:MAG: DNA repair and recombination protein RadB [Archaeoglobaceae archaeon]
MDTNQNQKLGSGSCIDDLLGGGIDTGTITQIYGESGTGKTSLCLMLAYRTALNGGKVVYMDTEGLSGERIEQIFKNRSALDNVFVYDIYDFKQQSSVIKNISKVCEKESIQLIIVDCFTSLYRSELEDDSKQVKMKRELTFQLTYLLGLARKHELAVVITNQMFTDIKNGFNKPLGGTSIDHLSKIIIGIQRINKKRRAVLMKHRSHAEGENCIFKITDAGIDS